MQNAFFGRGGYFDLLGYDVSAAQKIIESCKDIIHLARQKGTRIIFLQMDSALTCLIAEAQIHPSGTTRERPELKDKLQVYGTWGADIIDELKPQQGGKVIRNQKHDGFIGTNLDIILKTYDIRYLLFIGTATNTVFESTLMHSFFLDYFPNFVCDTARQKGVPMWGEC
jgi:ureidoacrylate peracid hydrolase